MILTGALVNGVAIVVGGLAGTFGGKLMPERMKQTLLTAAALLAMGIGISGLSSSNNQLIPILSLILGTIVGELLNIEHAVERMGAWLQKKFSGMGRITEGFVTGTLVFAVGAMAVMGGLDSGLKNDHTILFAKSIIDCVSAVAFASSMGIGVAFAGDGSGLSGGPAVHRCGAGGADVHRFPAADRHRPERDGPDEAAHPEHDARRPVPYFAVSIHLS